MADATQTQTQTRLLQGSSQSRAGSLAPASWDEESREVDLVWTTGATVRRRDAFGAYDEELIVSGAAVDMGRLNDGAPILRDHVATTESQVGVVVPGSARVEGGQGVLRARFSRRADAEGVVRDVADGILTRVSVGYRILEVEVVEREGQPSLYRVTRWEPLEVSLVPVPADASSGTRALEGDADPAARGGSGPSDTVDPGTARGEPTASPTLSQDTTSAETGAAAPSSQERSMTPEELAAANAEATRAATEAAVAAERARIADIQSRAAAVGAAPEVAQRLVAEGVSVERAAVALLDAVAEARAASATTGLRVLRDESAARAEVIENAMAFRSGLIAAPSEAGRELAGYSFPEMLREVARAAGQRGVGAMSRADLVDAFLRRDLQGSTAFNVAFGNNIARALLRGANSIPETYAVFGETIDVDDFRELEMYGLGDLPGLVLNEEGEEIQPGLITDGKAERIALLTYARRVGLTRKLMINDQVGQTFDLVGRWGSRYTTLRGDKVWNDAIIANPVMHDTKALFHASRGNLLPASGLTFESLAAARTAQRNMKSATGETLNLTEQFLAVGPSDQTKAEQLLGVIQPTRTADVVAPVVANLSLIVEPRLEGKGFLLIANKAQTPGLKLAYLRGQRGLQSKVYDSREILGQEVAVWADFAAKVVAPEFGVWTPAPAAA